MIIKMHKVAIHFLSSTESVLQTTSENHMPFREIDSYESTTYLNYQGIYENVDCVYCKVGIFDLVN